MANVSNGGDALNVESILTVSSLSFRDSSVQSLTLERLPCLGAGTESDVQRTMRKEWGGEVG